MASPACLTSASKTRGSGCIDKFAGFVDGGAEVRVVDGSGFDEVDATAQGRFQGFGEVEKLIEGRQVAFGFEFNQEICVACLWIEVRAARGRAEDFEASHVVLAAKFNQLGLLVSASTSAAYSLAVCMANSQRLFRLTDHGG